MNQRQEQEQDDSFQNQKMKYTIYLHYLPLLSILIGVPKYLSTFFTSTPLPRANLTLYGKNHNRQPTTSGRDAGGRGPSGKQTKEAGREVKKAQSKKHSC